jgi:hypothetical protein
MTWESLRVGQTFQPDSVRFPTRPGVRLESLTY